MVAVVAVAVALEDTKETEYLLEALVVMVALLEVALVARVVSL
jgi:hypothetical protein